MFSCNCFTNVVTKVLSFLIRLPSICDKINPPLFAVCKSASSFFAVEAKIYKHYTTYRVRKKPNYMTKNTGYNIKLYLINLNASTGTYKK